MYNWLRRQGTKCNWKQTIGKLKTEPSSIKIYATKMVETTTVIISIIIIVLLSQLNLMWTFNVCSRKLGKIQHHLFNWSWPFAGVLECHDYKLVLDKYNEKLLIFRPVRGWSPLRAELLQPPRHDVRVLLSRGILPPLQRIQLHRWEEHPRLESCLRLLKHLPNYFCKD